MSQLFSFLTMKTHFNKLLLITFFTSIFFNVVFCASDANKNSDDIRDENGDTNDESKDESLDIPVEQGEPMTPFNSTCSRRTNSKIHEIKEAQHRQYPFVAAILSHQNEYICSGTVVSNGLVLTTARCLSLPVNYVLLNVTQAKKDESAVVLRITKSEKFPTYVNGEGDKDVGLIYTEKHNRSIATKVRLSNYTNAQSITDMEAFGFGLNTELGTARPLQYIGLENRNGAAPLDGKDMLKGFFDCYETKISTCFKDTGGPVISDEELIGIVVRGQTDCTKETSVTYALNKLYAEVLPTYTFKAWLEDKIKKNEEPNQLTLLNYPLALKPERRYAKWPRSSGGIVKPKISHFVLLILTNNLFM